MAEPSECSDTKPRTSQRLANLKRKCDEMLNNQESSDLEHQPNLNVDCSKVFIGIKNDLVQEELAVSDRTLDRTPTVFTVGELSSKQLERSVNQDRNPSVAVASLTSYERTAISSEKMNKNSNETQAINNVRTISELESINEDCFRQIVRYLNIVDVSNLAATCPQLLDLAEDVVFPKKAKNIYIKIFSETKVYLTSPLNNAHTFAMTLQKLETSFSYFGKFVENLTFICYKCDSTEQSKIERSLAIIIEYCGNLSTLHYYCDFQPFTAGQTRAFKRRIEMLQNLKELELCGCPGITSNWPKSLDGSSKLEKLTLIGKNEFSDNFFDYFTNLSSLNVVFLNSDWQAEDISKIFNKTGHSLKQLALRHVDFVHGYETVGLLITEKLPNLESLELSFELTDDSEYMIALPQLRSLTIMCDAVKSINAMLRSLSDNGIVDKLRINGGRFDAEAENASPLMFPKLLSFDWAQKGGLTHFLTALTKAEMPVIHSIGMNRIKADEIIGVLELLESKRTLKNVDLTFDMTLIPFSFWQQLIAVLKGPCVPKRTLLNLVISGNRLNKEEIDYLNSNQDCIKLDYSF